MPATISNSNDITSHIYGKPQWLTSSPSGSISLSISLQEDKIFLASPNTSVASYNDNEHNEHGMWDLAQQQSQSLISPWNTISSASSSPKAKNDGKIRKRISPQRMLQISSLPSYSKPLDLPSSILRGSLLMKLTKPTKIKDVSVRFYGKCKTDWLESNIDEQILGGPHFFDEVIISSHSWKYVSAPPGSADQSSIVTINSTSIVSTNLFGADVVQFLPTSKKASVTAENNSKVEFKKGIPDHDTNLPLFTPSYFQPDQPDDSVEPKPTPFTSRSNPTVYPAGQYVFNFDIAIDARTADSTMCSNGGIKYFVVAKITRPSHFALNVSCQREVELIRSPPNMADMSSQGPLSISRCWDNRLQYEINSPQSYISLGSPIPLSIKLTPLEKIRLHRVKVQIVEDVTYISSWFSQMKHKDPTRKIMCFYKSSSGCALNKYKKKAPGANLLKLEEGFFAGTTEFDASIDLNTTKFCGQDAINYLRPDVVFNPLIHVKHRLHISFRISKQDTYDLTRKYYELLVDVPIHFLSPHCKADSIQLPQYIDLYENTTREPTRNEDTESEFGQPLVHALSSLYSRSPELSCVAHATSNFPNIDFIALDSDAVLPSFDLSQEIHRRRASEMLLSPAQIGLLQRRESLSSAFSQFTSSDESITSDTPPNYNSIISQANAVVVGENH